MNLNFTEQALTWRSAQCHEGRSFPFTWCLAELQLHLKTNKTKHSFLGFPGYWPPAADPFPGSPPSVSDINPSPTPPSSLLSLKQLSVIITSTQAEFRVIRPLAAPRAVRAQLPSQPAPSPLCLLLNSPFLHPLLQASWLHLKKYLPAGGNKNKNTTRQGGTPTCCSRERLPGLHPPQETTAFSEPRRGDEEGY